MATKSRIAQRANIASVDPIWAELRQEAEEVVRNEPALGGFIYATILSQDRLEDAVCHRLAQRLNHSDVDAGPDRPDLHAGAAPTAPSSVEPSGPISPPSTIAIPPAAATSSRCSTSRASTPSSRTASPTSCWKRGRRDFALYLQSQSSRIFAVDINPAARIGIGIMLDHGTGIVIGETATHRRQLLAAAGRDARRHRQGDRRPPSQDRRQRHDRRRRQGAGQHHRSATAAASPRAASCSRTCRRRRRWRACRPRWSGPPAAPSQRAPWTSDCCPTIAAAAAREDSTVNPQEMVRVQTYMRKVFGTKTLSVRARPKIKDSAEVYVGDDFIGTLTRRGRGRRAVLPVPDGDPRARPRGDVTALRAIGRARCARQRSARTSSPPAGPASSRSSD